MATPAIRIEELAPEERPQLIEDLWGASFRSSDRSLSACTAGLTACAPAGAASADQMTSRFA